MKVRTPLVPRSLGGIDCPYPMVTLLVRDLVGEVIPMRFRIDTGSDCTAMPAATAQKEGIGHQKVRASEAHGLVGRARKYRDSIHIVLAGREHTWPCDFVDMPAPTGQTFVSTPPAVLGRAGFLDEYAVAIDAGYAIITRLGPLRRLLRRCLHGLWAITGQVDSPESPL